jgi:hypothetical protein
VVLNEKKMSKFFGVEAGVRKFLSSESEFELESKKISELAFESESKFFTPQFTNDQLKYWHEYAEHFDSESGGGCYDVDIDSEDSDILYSLQYSCEELDHGAEIEKNSDYNYDTSYVEGESVDHEVPSRH